MMHRSDATSVGDVGPLAAPGRTKRIAPYVIATLVGVLAMPFDRDAVAGARWIAACLSAVAIATALAVRWPGLPRSAQLVPPALQLAAVAICIHADGGLASPYLSLLVVPLLWLAVYESRRSFGFGLAAASTVVLYELSTRVTADDLARGAIALGVGCAVVPSIRRLVAEIHDQARALSHLADHDALTGLPNRRALDRRIDASSDDRAGLGMIYLDIDSFKAINDTLGHETGDELLRQIAQRLSTATRAGDLVGRLGGDEFVIIIADGGRAALEGLAHRVTSAIRGEPFQLGAAIVSVSASVGVSHSSEGGRHAQQLLRDADQAMYAHKRGRHRCATIHDAGGHLVVDWPPGDDDAAGPCEA